MIDKEKVVTLVWLLMVTLLVGAGAIVGQQDAASVGGSNVYLPLVVNPVACTGGSSNNYNAGGASQFDLDNPVRPTDLHADKNIDLRQYSANNGSFQRELIDYGSDDPTQPPQLATAFSPTRVPAFANFYQVHSWSWAPSPNPGTQGPPNTNWPVSAIGFNVPAGEIIRVPSSGYDIGGGMEVIVLYADENSVTLRYAREDSAGSAGYTVHIDGICTDSNLLNLYNQLDSSSGPRYTFVPPQNRPYGYDLPNLAAGHPVGVAAGEVVLAIVDSGAFMDTRSCNEWWQVRPGYGGSCPPA